MEDLELAGIPPVVIVYPKLINHRRLAVSLCRGTRNSLSPVIIEGILQLRDVIQGAVIS